MYGFWHLEQIERVMPEAHELFQTATGYYTVDRAARVIRRWIRFKLSWDSDDEVKLYVRQWYEQQPSGSAFRVFGRLLLD